jgi:hypothetical protein
MTTPNLPGTLGRSLAYWFRSPRINGNVRGAGYILADGSVVAIDLTVWAHRSPPIGAVGFVLQTQVGWSAEVWSDLLDRAVQGMGDTPAEAVADAAANVKQREDEERAVRADPASHLERELDRHDWWACMSDSYGVEVAADRHMKDVIDPLIDAVPVDVVRALWAKHAPWQFACPV